MSGPHGEDGGAAFAQPAAEPGVALRGARVIRLEQRHHPAAALLCAESLARHRLLDPRFPEVPAPGAYEALLRAYRDRLHDPDAAAFGLLRGDRLAGTLVAAFRRLPPASSERLFSPLAGAWLPQSLCACAADCAPADVIPPLYGAAAAWLADRGITLHFATAAAADAAMLGVWRALGFRSQGVFALLPHEARDRLSLRPPPDGVSIRPARPADEPAIVALLSESHRYHAQLPGAFFDPEDGDRHYPALVHAELRSRKREPRYMLAHGEDGAVLGLASAYLERAPDGDLAALTRPLPLGYIAEVAVTERARGRGIAAALIASQLPWFASRGAAHVGLHYIANNPTAARAWPALGFVPLEVRLQGGPDPSKLGLPELVVDERPPTSTLYM